MKYFIKTFGCAQNEADSERIAVLYESRGYTRANTQVQADDIVINTCMIRQSAENRVYGLVRNLTLEKKKGRNVKIILTGCMVGMAVREKTGSMLASLTKKMPGVDEFLPIEEVGFDYAPVRTDTHHAWIPITNGCNNFCSYCVVPYTRGREVSRPIEDILKEVRDLSKRNITHVTLVGQNVNSYGADLQASGRKITYVKHLGRMRIPTLFPALLREVCAVRGIRCVDFISANPWDFSDDLIAVMKKSPKISRHVHLPVQSGDDDVLRRMNRWYTRDEYLALVEALRANIPDITISTDIIVGFPGETNGQFDHTVDLVKRARFTKAYIARYSDRPMTLAHKTLPDNVPESEKKRRWQKLEDLINKTNLKKGTYVKSIRYAA